MKYRNTLSALIASLFLITGAAHAEPSQEITEAERSLFMTDQMSGLKAPITLSYSFKRSGNQEVPFQDTVEVRISEDPAGRKMATSCLSGARKTEIPEVDAAQSNPALMCFLERDIREMERLTGGKSNYFRKRIRLALAEGPAAKTISVNFGGKSVDAREYRITPYENDPNKQKFPKYLGKTYVFVLSDAVPGGLYRVDTIVPDGNGVLIEEDMVLAGVSK
ncbi:hypothetical protein [Methyloversatilis thermotolerans]|uniref:hypothetical protein n=1 Tax=Methyloversatilis thermotolerans TaxID=1346290 RepID=UPI000365957D|nr:hypothetical protein [Methyloversatilis thermotolerans]